AIAGLKAAEVEVLPQIAPARRNRTLPLSFNQENLWGIHAALPAASWNHIGQTLHIQGALDADALERALLDVLRRHEALRTTFVEEDGTVFQRISDQVELELGLWDLAPLPPEERRKRAQRVAQAEIGEPFDLSRDRLLRPTLIRLAKDEHLLVLSMHHIVADGWSVRTLTADLVVCYAARAAGAEPQLPQPAIQFADVAVWERDCAQNGLFEADLRFWRQRLAGCQHDLRLARDAVSTPVPAMRQAFVRIDPKTSRRLGEWARAEHSTVFIALCAAWKMLLRRYSTNGAVSLCTLVSNRSRAETESIVGPMLNTVVLRTEFPADMAFRDVARAVRATALEAYAHQAVPFEFLLRDLERTSSVTRSSLSKVLFVYEDIDAGADDVPGLRITPVTWESNDAPDTAQPTSFDLVLVAAQESEGIGLSLRYRSDRFEPETIRRQLADLAALVGAVVSAPQPVQTQARAETVQREGADHG
ncbi:condensation domain-containing protein, partial [Mesorhizobium mediterraneum]|uniref:condensation domain-containing protein n=1 Tax=Mesorhizobium mediterraneum TaxID=43617 RepID=UPI001FEE1E3A